MFVVPHTILMMRLRENNVMGNAYMSTRNYLIGLNSRHQLA